jgi:acetyl esterase/lipase
MVALRFIDMNIRVQKYGESEHKIIEVIEPKNISKDISSSVLIFVHGGAWGSGKPWMYRLMCLKLAIELGMSRVVLVGYPVYPLADICNQVSSINEAVLFVHQELFPMTTSVLVGHSSGANICALCLIHHYKDLQQYVRKFIGISGVYDISAHFEWEKSRGVHEVSPMKAAAGNSREKFKACSPSVILSRDKFPIKEKLYFPSTMLIHSENDVVVPLSSSLEFAVLLRNHSVLVEVFFPKVSSSTHFICY